MKELFRLFKHDLADLLKLFFLIALLGCALMWTPRSVFAAQIPVKGKPAIAITVDPAWGAPEFEGDDTMGLASADHSASIIISVIEANDVYSVKSQELADALVKSVNGGKVQARGFGVLADFPTDMFAGVLKTLNDGTNIIIVIEIMRLDATHVALIATIFMDQLADEVSAQVENQRASIRVLSDLIPSE